MQYLNLVQEVIAEGYERSDRTGTGTLACFGRSMRFSLRHGSFPLLTTKKTFFRGGSKLAWFCLADNNCMQSTACTGRTWGCSQPVQLLMKLAGGCSSPDTSKYRALNS